MTGCNGNWKSLAFFPFAAAMFGGGVTRGRGGGVAAGAGGLLAPVRDGGGGTVAVSPSSKRRSNPFNNPVNFDLTKFGMTSYAIPVFSSLDNAFSIQQEVCHCRRKCGVLSPN